MSTAHDQARVAGLAEAAAGKAAFKDDSDADLLATARAAGLAAVRADRAAFSNDQSARLADARQRARAAACRVRTIAAWYAKDEPQCMTDMDSAARQAEEAVASDDADKIYDAALFADYRASYGVWPLDRDGRDRTADLKAAEARCGQHRHPADDENDADAAYSAKYSAYNAARLAAYELLFPQEPDRRAGYTLSWSYLWALRTCCRKVRFESEPEAREAAETGSRGRGKQLWPYERPCDVCRGWHLTSHR